MLSKTTSKRLKQPNLTLLQGEGISQPVGATIPALFILSQNLYLISHVRLKTGADVSCFPLQPVECGISFMLCGYHKKTRRPVYSIK